ncbi:exopolysaccharide biosynthesis protein [Roseicella aerolata]|uniref:Exopolysaccharide biosynthesis protein n=1 Tax=Roseicella aerolata TaxID=2883479 RepID=A0A9X1IAN4_9PROT|nr:exopolysaccharide biosynthesis protein [Roseicella aerolata]MCB4821316.1 exopolysaccharide biosynthesis protein [Roseicella aerolata]
MPARPVPAEIALGVLLDRFRRAGHGVVLLALALPAVIPVPLAGLPAGLGLLVAGMRLLLGSERPWLPGALRRVRLPRPMVGAALGRFVRLLRRAGLRPRRRLEALGGPWGRQLAGLAVLINAGVILLPLPLGNQLPALAVASFGLGLLRRDGALLLAGHALTAAGLAWAATLLLVGHRLASWATLLLWN